ncbi:FxsB family radical SAM/SPASM domain protein, partial [Streptomyces sp. 8P21H-1]|nr:FxsB family radical SAM/SPASM domain protein [Streptomyces sp. 8P21H-1]
MTAPPVQQLVLKIHSRCDLACDHCYVYEHADQSWRARPVVISEETVTRVADRFAAYAQDRGLESVSVILHGGEPLLAGPARLRRTCAEFTRALAPVAALDLRIHTNGVQLGRRHMEVFKEYAVKVSISLDGDRRANDVHRKDRRGRSSYDKVLKAIDLLRLPEYGDLFAGLLCTVDVGNDPVAVHDALTALDPPRIDYLLPHSTWDNPPPRPPESPTPYADWLLSAFDRWEEQGRRVPVRTFDSVLSTLRGGPSLTEAMGLAPSDLAVVETDGTFEQADSLKTAYAGAPATGYDVFRHGFEEFATHPGVRARQRGADGVSDTCRACPVLDSCGGGLYAHRYRTGSGFDNPSVFCADLRALVEGVAERLTDRTLAPGVHDPWELRFAQAEVNRGLLARANERLAGPPDWDAAWRTVLRLDADSGTAEHLDAVLAHPYVRPTLLHSSDGCGSVARFASTVTAAALRAGAPAVLSWDQPDGEVHLPTLGTLRLPGAGRVEATVTPEGLRLRHSGGTAEVPGRAAGRPAGGDTAWRPLVTLDLGRGAYLLIDDADPYRDVYPVPVAPALDPSDLAMFVKRVRTAYETLNESRPGWHEDADVLAATTITPLTPGSGLRPGPHGLGALGVALDFEAGELLRELPRAGRLARLDALRETADLHVPGNSAGRLLTEAGEQLAEAAYWGRETPPRDEALRRA